MVGEQDREPDDELKKLYNQQAGEQLNEAAGIAWLGLARLGAHKGEVDMEYRLEVAKCLVGCLAATSATRICVEHVTGALSDKQRTAWLCRLIGTAFESDEEAARIEQWSGAHGKWVPAAGALTEKLTQFFLED